MNPFFCFKSFFLLITIVLFELNKNGLALDDSSNSHKNICQSEACHRLGSIIKNDSNFNADPCDNFYEFSCGNYVSKTEIPRGYDYWRRQNNESLDSIQKLNESMNKPITDQDPESIKKLKTFYKMCIRGDFNKTLEKKEKDFFEVFNDITNSTGGWPIVSGGSWNSSHITWTQSIEKFRKLGIDSNFFFDVDFRKDKLHKDQLIFQINQPKLGIDTSILSKGFDSNETKEYFEKLINLSKKFKVADNIARLELNKSLHFEIELAKCFGNQNPKIKETIMTVDELEKKFPRMDWYSYLDTVNEEIPKPTDKVEIYNEQSLGKVLNLIVNTTDDVLTNYIFSRFVKDLNERLNVTIMESDCLTLVNYEMYMASSALYIKEHFNLTIRSKVMEIAKDICDSVTQIITDSNWMDNKLKEIAKNITKSIEFLVAIPEKFLNDTILDDFHKDLFINPKNSFATELSIKRFESKNMLELINGVNEHWMAHLFPGIVKINSAVPLKLVKIPVSVLQPGVFFDMEAPNYVYYATIGHAIGHEITHILDTHFRNDKNWENPGKNERYLNKSSCIQKQYGNYTEKTTGLKINGDRTKVETIGDYFGIKAALLAYEKSKKDNREELSLPGLESYTNEQLFWMSYALKHCTKFTREGLVKYLNENVHPPGEYRVIGTVSNMPEFSNAFHCKNNSKMNPSSRCSF